MKFETIMLNGLFIACVAVCALVMGAMLKATPSQLAGSHKAIVAALAVPATCAPGTTGVACPRANG
ncbi:MAG TPA: hypothetical protein VGC19_12920 [Rhodanobacter sp.]